MPCLVLFCLEDKCIDAAEDECKCDAKTDECNTQSNTGTGSGTAEHLAVGSQFTFCINLLQASGIPAEYCDVYCQFRYLPNSASLLVDTFRLSVRLYVCLSVYGHVL